MNYITHGHSYYDQEQSVGRDCAFFYHQCVILIMCIIISNILRGFEPCEFYYSNHLQGVCYRHPIFITWYYIPHTPHTWWCHTSYMMASHMMVLHLIHYVTWWYNTLHIMVYMMVLHLTHDSNTPSCGNTPHTWWYNTHTWWYYSPHMTVLGGSALASCNKNSKRS